MHQLRRFAIPGALLFATLAVIIGPSYVGSSAQTGSPRTSEVASASQQDALADHPIVGAWVVINTEQPGQPNGFVIFHADGTIISTDANDVSSYGVWEAEDETSVDFNILGFSLRSRSIRGNSGPQSVNGIRSLLGSASVLEGGDRFEATATLTTTTRDGGGSLTEPGAITLLGMRIDLSGADVMGRITPRGTRAAPASPAA